jgi:4-amino-4-deoxy-L-arabinose transferase-like glycosyltransferase
VSEASFAERLARATQVVAQRASPTAAARTRGISLAAVGWAMFATGIALAVFLRFWRVDAVGFNSDEAVYAGQAAAIADVPELEPYFPVFRAHPLLFQTIHSIGYQLGAGDAFGRLLAGAFGLATVVLVFELGRLLYGRRAGAVAAVLMALMPYHVVVSRQVLLDGPQTFFLTLTLYFLVRFAIGRRAAWLYAAGGAMGLSVLSKETSILVVGAAYAFFALSPEVGARLRDLAVAGGLMVVAMAAYPLSLQLAGHSRSGHAYLAYQLFRRPNHDWTFYAATVPKAMGFLVVALAVAGLVLYRKRISWRETLLVSWIVVPALFFQLYPVKGFQYLLPTAPAVALLAARTLALWSPALELRGRRVPPALPALLAAAVVAVSLALPSWQRTQFSPSTTFLAGSGGVPGGREMGRWIRSHVPEGATFLTIGPSMANIVQFYGHRRAYGLSVGTNPLRRNPAYDPLPNPDFSIRSNDVQYLVWDAFSAARTSFFTEKLLGYVRRYNGRAVRTESIEVATQGGSRVRKPVIVVYAVRP